MFIIILLSWYSIYCHMPTWSIYFLWINSDQNLISLKSKNFSRQTFSSWEIISFRLPPINDAICFCYSYAGTKMKKIQSVCKLIFARWADKNWICFLFYNLSSNREFGAQYEKLLLYYYTLRYLLTF